ncbi:MAG: hypothetical protein LUG93_17345 [Lachnospiraceae bacterium]|nr:hypothetical protein [Lachnospiraceae bacterium]
MFGRHKNMAASESEVLRTQKERKATQQKKTARVRTCKRKTAQRRSVLRERFSKIKEHLTERKTERDAKAARIKADPRYKRMIEILNRYSILFHALLSCAICFLIEWVSRHSFLEACAFMVDRNLVFLYNAFLVWTTLLFVYIVKRRAAARTFISVFWLFLGVVNGIVLANRVSPFGWTDLSMVSDLLTMRSSYFTDWQAVIAIVIVAALCVMLAYFWVKGPKYEGKTHRVSGAVLAAAVLVLVVPGVTDAAKSNNVLTEYFSNLAQGYKDYGFVYSFTSSALDTGMSEPEGYSEDAIAEILAKTEE